jgi:hypothetical protein
MVTFICRPLLCVQVACKSYASRLQLVACNICDIPETVSMIYRTLYAALDLSDVFCISIAAPSSLPL